MHILQSTRACWQRLVLALGLALCVTGASASELRRTATVRAVQRVEDAVVNVFGEKKLGPGQEADGQHVGDRRVNGMGTGVVIDPRGYIITNHHVVDGVEKINITLSDGETLAAELVAFDFRTDLAVIKVKSKHELPVAPIGRSDDLMRGEPVIAVGNAFGYGHSVTTGIISALHRKVQVNEMQTYDDLIQTDASINPGNSGGPLINIDGEMIGVNVAVRAGAQGIGFAIPADKAMAVAADLLSVRRLRELWHGATLKDVFVDDNPTPMVVDVEPKSPAEAAGLRPGDRLSRLDQLCLTRSVHLELALLDHRAGDEVELVVQRGEETLKLSLGLAALPANESPAEEHVWEVLGVRLKPMPATQFRRLSKRYRGGLEVAEVRSDSPASRQGIRAGDVLVGMHVWETVTIENVNYVINRPDLAKLSPLKFYVLRGDETLFGYIQLANRPTR